MNKPVSFFAAFLTGLLFFVAAAAQNKHISPADRKLLIKKEDSLKVFADSMINAEYAGKRFLSDSQFVKTFVRALKTKNSFYYPFDSLQTVSIL